MKKRLGILIVVIIALAVIIWFLVFRKADMYSVRQGIPEDAVFVVETPSFNSIRDKLHHNQIWTSLKEYPYFESYHANLNLADSLSTTYPVLRKLLTDRPFAVSCHILPDKSYDFLYICDLGKLNIIRTLDGLVGNLLEKGKIIKKGELTEFVWEDMKLYYAIKANLLFLSFTPTLVEKGMDACVQEVVREKMAFSGDLNLQLNHHQLEKLGEIMLGQFSGQTDSSAFEKTEFALNLKDKGLYFKGETWPNQHHFTLLSALNLMDGAKSQIKTIVSDRTAGYVSMCFSSFAELENILTDEYRLNNLKQYAEYERTLKRLNKYLGVDLVQLFTSWIGNEIAVIKPAVDKENRLDNLVLAVKSKDIDLAKDQLGYLTEQIGRKTPVRFREIEYNGHHISYLSLKGFFSLFLGSLFKKFDHPYYTFIGDYVVFSNSASTLTGMIKDYSLGNTLERDERFNLVMEQLGDRNNVYGYVSSAETYEYLYRSLQSANGSELVKNRGAFQSFESIGFSMKNTGNAYETHVIANHNVDAPGQNEARELNRELEDLADRVESGYYHVVIPDSIAISTRGEYTYSTDELTWTGHLSNGDPEGIWNIKDRQGHAVAQYVYRSAMPDGEARFFYPHGVVRAQVDYRKGRIESYKEFFPDGTLKMELEYNKGVRHGHVRFYYSTGHLLGEGKYKKGRRTGTWKYYQVTGETKQKLKF